MANSTHGLRAESMQPRFPTQTFPNHWSLMTGLYPESHGIIANDFWDPQMQRDFVYTKHDMSWDARWWWGEPMWSVAQRGGRISANIMWPGPPVTSQGIAPALFVPYRVGLVLDWQRNVY
jgi:predicted AlkP superfamily pyrophosphatase or phosphodiesterase